MVGRLHVCVAALPVLPHNLMLPYLTYLPPYLPYPILPIYLPYLSYLTYLPHLKEESDEQEDEGGVGMKDLPSSVQFNSTCRLSILPSVHLSMYACIQSAHPSILSIQSNPIQTCPFIKICFPYRERDRYLDT